MNQKNSVLIKGAVLGAFVFSVAFVNEARADKRGCSAFGGSSVFQGDAKNAKGKNMGYSVCFRDGNYFIVERMGSEQNKPRKNDIISAQGADIEEILKKRFGTGSNRISSGARETAVAAARRKHAEWAGSQFGRYANAETKQNIQKEIDQQNAILAIGNTTLKLGEGGNVNCDWKNKQASTVETDAGVSECQGLKSCARPVECTMQVGNQRFSFDATAKCGLSYKDKNAKGLDGKKGCNQDPNACAGQVFNGKKGYELPGWSASTQDSASAPAAQGGQ